MSFSSALSGTSLQLVNPQAQLAHFLRDTCHVCADLRRGTSEGLPQHRLLNLADCHGQLAKLAGNLSD
jgi:hypothetical protein